MSKDHSHENVLGVLFESIAYLGIPARKELLKITRVQRSIDSNRFLRSKTGTAMPTYACAQDVYV